MSNVTLAARGAHSTIRGGRGEVAGVPSRNIKPAGEYMPTLSVFNSISADGYFTGANGDLS